MFDKGVQESTILHPAYRPDFTQSDFYLCEPLKALSRENNSLRKDHASHNQTKMLFHIVNNQLFVF